MTFNDMDEIVQNGISLVIDGTQELFIVVVFLVTDLSMLEKILGKCSTNSMYGCFWCTQSKNKWSVEQDQQTSKLQTVTEMTKLGIEAKETLGINPDHYSTSFTKFQQSHLGQYVSIYSSRKFHSNRKRVKCW